MRAGSEIHNAKSHPEMTMTSPKWPGISHENRDFTSTALPISLGWLRSETQAEESAT